MAASNPIGVVNNIDNGGDVICCKYVRTGFNNPGLIFGSATTVAGSAGFQSVGAGASLTMTADKHLGTTVLMDTASGSTVTLPAATGTGNSYTILVSTTVTSNTSTLQCAGSDKMNGTFFLGSTTAALTDASIVALNQNTSIAMNGTTTGGIKGSVFYVTDIATNLWLVEALLVGSGTTAITGIT